MRAWLQKIKDPVSCLTHLVGAVFSAIGLIVLLKIGIQKKDHWHLVGYLVFGLSLLFLYTASTLYHMLNISEKVNIILRKIDHMMIFVLIAGTYTPICLTVLRGGWGWSILTIVWTMSLLGVGIKVFWLDAPRWLSTGIYLLLGWLIIVAFYPLFQRMTLLGLLLLILGGLFYTLGAVIYGLKKPRLNIPHLGFHEIFHLFVMGGSVCHYLMVLTV